MSVGGVQVGLAVGKQADKLTAATTVYQSYYDEVDETAGRIEDRGRPEIGGGLATGLSIDVFGARPSWNLRAKPRLGFLGFGLGMVGYGSVGTAPATNGTIVFNGVSVGTAWPHYTLSALYQAGVQFGLLAARATLFDLDFQPGAAPVLTMAGPAREHKAISTSHTAELANFVPTPAAAITAAQRVVFGAGTAIAWGLGMRVEAVHDTDNQPIGDILSDDVVPTQYVTSFRLALAMGSATYRRLIYGSSAGTAVSSVLETGALLFRINTASNVVAGTLGFIEFDAANTVYTMAGPIRVLPGRQVLVPVLAYPTALPTIRILNGTTGSAY